jgi:hypothetical protein
MIEYDSGRLPRQARASKKGWLFAKTGFGQTLKTQNKSCGFSLFLSLSSLSSPVAWQDHLITQPSIAAGPGHAVAHVVRPADNHTQRAHMLRRQPLSENASLSFSSAFPYGCPEPVLVK